VDEVFPTSLGFPIRKLLQEQEVEPDNDSEKDKSVDSCTTDEGAGLQLITTSPRQDEENF
jgi:hypothetical protein